MWFNSFSYTPSGKICGSVEDGDKVVVGTNVGVVVVVVVVVVVMMVVVMVVAAVLDVEVWSPSVVVDGFSVDEGVVWDWLIMLFTTEMFSDVPLMSLLLTGVGAESSENGWLVSSLLLLKNHKPGLEDTNDGKMRRHTTKK